MRFLDVKRKALMDLPGKAALEEVIAQQLRTGLASIDSKQPEAVIGMCLRFSFISANAYMLCIAQASGHEVWQATLDMVKALSEAMLHALPSFWKIAKGYMDGKYKKVSDRMPSIASVLINRLIGVRRWSAPKPHAMPHNGFRCHPALHFAHFAILHSF